MRIRIKRNTVVNGVAVNAGAIVDTNEIDGKYLVQIGKAELVTDAIETADAAVDAIETADIKRPSKKK